MNFKCNIMIVNRINIELITIKKIIKITNNVISYIHLIHIQYKQNNKNVIKNTSCISIYILMQQ